MNQRLEQTYLSWALNKLQDIYPFADVMDCTGSYEDLNHNTDIIVGGMRCGFRCRRRWSEHYVTFRTGAAWDRHLEWEKLIDGWGDLMLYCGIYETLEEPRYWVLVDLGVIRDRWHDSTLNFTRHDNGDTTGFLRVRIDGQMVVFGSGRWRWI